MGSDGDWRERAACAGADTELFFPGPGDQSLAFDSIKRWCADCPVQVPCRDAGRGEPGVWGAMTGRQRRQLNNSHRLPPAPKGCEWVWDDEHEGWQLCWQFDHARPEG